MTDSAGRDSELLYQADDRPPAGIVLGQGLQFAVLFLGGLVLPPTIVFRAAGMSEAALGWAVFASLLVAGAATALQAFPIRRFGAGYLLVTGATNSAIAVSIAALDAGGPALLASLMLASALLPLLFSFRMSAFRRVLTPTVSGTILMLIPLTVAPIVFERMAEVPAGYPRSAGLACFLATLAPIVAIAFGGGARLRPWAPVVGILGGAAAAAAQGLYDLDRVARAAWIGLPRDAGPALEFDFGPAFWALLPAMLLVSLSGALRTASAAMAIQDVSWRAPRAPDPRAAQGAVAADAAANLLAALGGAVPQSTRPATAAIIRIARVAASRVGLALGATLVVLAFVPKAAASMLALPGPVFAAYVLVMISGLFATGAKMVVAEGLDHRRTLIVGLSFWIGAGCQYGLVFPETLPRFADGLLASGLTTGGLTAIGLTVLAEAMAGRRRALEADLDLSSLPAVREFVQGFARARGWSPAMADRLDAVSEEALLTLVGDEAEAGAERRRLRISARREGDAAVLEFVARLGEGNIEDRMAVLGDAQPGERDISLRLLRHLASEVRHRQYRDIDIVAVRVEDPGGGAKE